MPHLVVIGGPNGAGKSTAAPKLLRDTLDIVEFVNADHLAIGLSGFRPEAAAFQAGRVMLGRLRDLSERGASFAFESTLASRSFAPFIGRLRERGYDFLLVYLWLANAKQAKERVADRVRSGGHSVPGRVVTRRYRRSLLNFFQLYRALADEWRFYDNSGDFDDARLVAAGSGRAVTSTPDSALWEKLMRRYGRDVQRS
jgi:predicted ABC-type ATPase